MGTSRLSGRLRGVRYRLVVMVGLTLFVAVVYVVVVLGGGAIIGRTDSPSVPLSILATATVALLFAPVQAALEGTARRMGLGAAATPYDVLSRFPADLGAEYATEQLPARMSRLLAEGTGAQWAQVWLTISERLTLAATWPVDAEDGRPLPPSVYLDGVDATGNGRRALAVRHGGQLLGVLQLQERPGVALTAVEGRLFAGLAAQAGLVLRLVALQAELTDRHAELAARGEELRASRERLIATQDAERRRLERDIHDGAQQHLVALIVNLRLAQAIAAHSPERAARVLSEQTDAARLAIETLSTLSRGIYPRTLTAEGLVPALRLAVARSPVPVTIDAVDLIRLPAPVEAALYFCCMEAVQNAAKHSGAQSVLVQFGEDQGHCRLTVMDNGSGFDPGHTPACGTGAGLVNMADRMDAVGGTVTVGSVPGLGTTVTVVVPRIEEVVQGRRLIAVPGRGA